VVRRQYFRSLDRDQQRAYLAEETILAERSADSVLMVSEVIRDDEGGVATIMQWPTTLRP
jgi:hypothetical protein